MHTGINDRGSGAGDLQQAVAVRERCAQAPPAGVGRVPGEAGGVGEQVAQGAIGDGGSGELHHALAERVVQA